MFGWKQTQKASAQDRKVHNSMPNYIVCVTMCASMQGWEFILKHGGRQQGSLWTERI